MPVVIKDRILYPPSGVQVEPKLIDLGSNNIGEEVLKRFRNTLEQHGDYDWLINGPYDLTGTTSTCGVRRKRISEIEVQARQVASSFYQNGLRKGDVVHLVIPNNTEYHITVIGAWLCEATVSLGDPGLSLKVMETQLKDTQAKFVVCFDGSRKVVHEALKNLHLLGQVQVLVLELACPRQGQDQPIIEPGFRFYKDFLCQVGDQPVPKLQNGPLQDDEIFVIFWSSGTTGVPKGIQHCVKYFRKMVPDYQDRGSKSPLFSTYLQSTCYFHVGGFISPMNAITHPLSFVFNHDKDLDADPTQLLFKQVDRFKPYMMICGSHHLVQLSQAKPDYPYDLSSVRLVSPMGNTVPHDLFDTLKPCLTNLYTIYHYYGMTEAGGIMAKTFDVRHLGDIAEGIVLKLVDPETKELCDVDEVGEILANCGINMKGYLNRPEENAKFFAPNGFIHTGDLAHYDAKGFLYFDGRLKDLIKYKNCHLYPLEIEQVIGQHPDVIEAGVFGRPDPTVQEYVTALVVKSSESTVTEQDIIELVSQHVDDAKKLRGGVTFIDKLPKNPQGKLLRRELLKIWISLQK